MRIRSSDTPLENIWEMSGVCLCVGTFDNIFFFFMNETLCHNAVVMGQNMA